MPPLLRRLLRPLLDPYRRYRHARVIHAVRVSLGLLATILLTTGIHLPHGEWASVTMLVVIGGLQHHGNIGKKAAERAIGKGGYTALLSAITVFIVAGHGDNPITDGLWRGVDILIGIALALAFSFALPLYAVYSWRYNLADALRDCAKVYGRIIDGQAITADEHLKLMTRLNAAMVQLRSLMPSVSKEVKISMTELDAIQRNLRMCVSTLEILGNTRPDANDPEAMTLLQTALKAEHRQIRVQLIGMARALKSGATQRLDRPMEVPLVSLDAPVYNRLDGYRLLTRQLAANIGEMRQRLARSAPHWNI